MRHAHQGLSARACALSLAVLTLPALGCIGALAQGLYLFQGEKIPAEFEGLEGKRVAVVCLSNTAAAGPGSEADIVARLVSNLLSTEVKDIDIVHQDEVYDWMDNHNWDQTDYRPIGRGVKADRIVAIEISGFRLYEGSTLYKGRANVTVSVLDMAKDGQIVFRREMPDFSYPANTGHHTADITEARFRRLFLQDLSMRVARRFYDYDLIDTFATDTPIGSP